MPVLFDGLVVFVALLALITYRAWNIAQLEREHDNPQPTPKMTYWRMLLAVTKWRYEDFYHE